MFVLWLVRFAGMYFPGFMHCPDPDSLLAVVWVPCKFLAHPPLSPSPSALPLSPWLCLQTFVSFLPLSSGVHPKTLSFWSHMFLGGWGRKQMKSRLSGHWWVSDGETYACLCCLEKQAGKGTSKSAAKFKPSAGTFQPGSVDFTHTPPICWCCQYQTLTLNRR